MWFNLLFVIFVVATCLNYMFLDIKVDKLKKEIIEKDSLISAFRVLDKSINKLNTGFKDHERRIIDIENHLSLSREPEKPEKPEYTCKDCKYYNRISERRFRCEKNGLFLSTQLECIGRCQLFEKKENLDEDENVVYANNVKIDISSKGPTFYKADRILTYEEYVDRISRLFLDGAIGVATMNELLERLKQ